MKVGSNFMSNCELQTQFSQSYLYFGGIFFSVNAGEMFEDAVINFRIVILYPRLLKNEFEELVTICQKMTTFSAI